MGEEIVFTDESTDPDGEIAAYLWDFGDGLPETTANPSHVYEKEGDYTVTLIVWDDFGRAARYADTLHVGAGSETTRGDINGDGAINAKDVTILRRYIAGSSISAEKIAVGDINGDGAVDAKDVTVLRRYIAKNPA